MSMNIDFPSSGFDEAVAAVCHGTVSEEQARALNALLRQDVGARDEYLFRLELHSRLASEPDLFAGAMMDAVQTAHESCNPPPRQTASDPTLAHRSSSRKKVRAIALAAGLALAVAGWWALGFRHEPQTHLETQEGDRLGTTSTAVAMLNRVADVEWMSGTEAPGLGAPIEPGWLKIQSGLVQIVFYSGARVAIQGPAELEILSANEAICRRGRLIAEVPPQARGFRIGTPELSVSDLGTSFGLEVFKGRTELHVFSGAVAMQSATGDYKKELREGSGVVVADSGSAHPLQADPEAFAMLFELQVRSRASEAERHDQWRAASRRLNDDPSLCVHLDFETATDSEWQLRNLGFGSRSLPNATTVGCQWTHGRWPGKRALEFQGVSDRVRLTVPGSFESLSVATWVRVQGLDRTINSLFMCDGFVPGTIHWLIRNDGVLGLTVIGDDADPFQIVASPPVITLDQFGMWLHLAVVLDGEAGRVTQYVNGLPVHEEELTIAPPFHIGPAELGNWHARGFSGDDPFLIRNFSGAMDEFLLFGRALGSEEVRDLYYVGKPELGPSLRAPSGH